LPSVPGKSNAIATSSKPGNGTPARVPGRIKPVSRVSISLPQELLDELDTMVSKRGFDSRSQAVNDMLHKSLLDHKRTVGDDVMVGIVTLFYNNSVQGLQKQLAGLQARHIAEVISSLHVHLMHNQTMEVVLVQGPAHKLQEIADLMITLRGIISGTLQLITALIPQLHPLSTSPKRKRA
jgi:CopG family transcriptional regulator, nickel-responsive regulator